MKNIYLKFQKFIVKIYYIGKSLIDRLTMLTGFYTRENREQMLVELYRYLNIEPDADLCNQKQRGFIDKRRKAYNYMEPQLISHNAWGIHFTDKDGFDGIRKSGFKIGVADFDGLAYPYEYNKYEDSKENGWNFAYPVTYNWLNDEFRYGEYGFIIQTDCVNAYHKCRDEEELIFRNCHIKKKFPFIYNDELDCWNLIGFGRNYKTNLPVGSFYSKDLRQVVFKDIHSMIEYVINVNS